MVLFTQRFKDSGIAAGCSFLRFEDLALFFFPEKTLTIVMINAGHIYLK